MDTRRRRQKALGDSPSSGQIRADYEGLGFLVGANSSATGNFNAARALGRQVTWGNRATRRADLDCAIRAAIEHRLGGLLHFRRRGTLAHFKRLTFLGIRENISDFDLFGRDHEDPETHDIRFSNGVVFPGSAAGFIVGWSQQFRPIKGELE